MKWAKTSVAAAERMFAARAVTASVREYILCDSAFVVVAIVSVVFGIVRLSLLFLISNQGRDSFLVEARDKGMSMWWF